MPDFQITGISSGIDWGSIIDTMMENKRAVQVQWLEEQDKLETRALMYQELVTNLSNLQSSLDPLKRESTFLGKSAEVTPMGTAVFPLSVTATPEAEINRYDVEVLSVAANHRVAGNRVDDAASALGHAGSFELSVGGFSVTVDITSGDSLNDIAKAINDAVAEKAEEAGTAPPLSAQVIDNTLIIAGTETGAANALSANDTDGVLAALGVVDAVGDFSRVLQEASDAVIVLDGLEVTRSSNTIDDLIEGVTFEVVAEGSAKVDVSLDAEPAVTAVKEMIDAYNETLDWINIRLTEETKEDPQSDVEKKWGLLKGDPLLWNCKQKMRNITSRARYDQEGGYNTLASIGIATESTDFGKSGKLEFDESAFMKAMLENPGRVKDIMQSFATEMADFSKGMISGTPEIIGGVTVKQGTLVNRIDTLEQQSSRIDKRIADFEARLEMEKASLEKLYTNMETRLSEMNYQSYYTSALWEYGSGNSNS